MEIKSSLFNSNSMMPVKNSLIKISEKDNKQDFRVKMLEYIDDSTSSEDDQFFWQMMEAIRFLDPSTEAIAYTTPKRLIYLNSPGKIGENIRQWEFIYEHECLHQLWDTWGVGDKIEKEGKKLNQDLLNIASDCVINDYLAYNRKKLPPEVGITPEKIKQEFGIEYDRKCDDQYSLYCKMLESENWEKIEEYAKQQEKIHNGKITPKEVKDGEGGGGGGGPQVTHSDDYKRGWVDGINDVLDGKVDPKTFTPKEEKGDYEKGYNDVLEQIKNGIENGIQQSKDGNDGGGGAQNDLPQIPWDAPNMNDENSDSSGDNDSESSDDNDSESSNDNDGKSSDKKDNTDKSSNKNGKEMSAEEAANAAKESAIKAEKAAKQAEEKAKNAKKNDVENADELEKSAESAREAADKAREAADKAQEAADDGDIKEANKQAKEAEKQAKRAQNQANKQEGKPGKGWSHAGNVVRIEGIDDSGEDADLEDIAKRLNDIVKEWQNKISGDIGLFNKKCKNATKLNKNGLVANTDKGASLWNNKMTAYIQSYVKNRVFSKHREFKRSYKRIKRGSGFIKFGEPLQKGKVLKDDKLIINVAFYVDISGSMYHCIDKVFDASYTISISLDNMFGRDKVVDSLSYKMFTFNDYIKEIKWGTKVPAGGGNVEFSEIVNYMKDKTKDYMVNVVITDAQFDINKEKVKKLMNELDGMLLFITNQGSKDMEQLSKELKDQVYYILADNNFTIKA